MHSGAEGPFHARDLVQATSQRRTCAYPRRKSEAAGSVCARRDAGAVGGWQFAFRLSCSKCVAGACTTNGLCAVRVYVQMCVGCVALCGAVRCESRQGNQPEVADPEQALQLPAHPCLGSTGMSNAETRVGNAAAVRQAGHGPYALSPQKKGLCAVAVTVNFLVHSARDGTGPVLLCSAPEPVCMQSTAPSTGRRP
mmetsp:Transcript_56702/g.94102  ORF Transcript_56702/g.94102 Transcript_56702/m.94102 type:complete len:196 (-) Transcript_56702:54-641(-)